MTVKVVSVKKTLKRAMLRRIQYQTKAQMQRWANGVLRQKITPVTPIDKGRLRREADVAVGIVGENIEMVYLNQAPYALLVERMREYGKSPRAPGTIAPFAEPTIREAIRQTIADPIGKGFTL